MVAPTGYVPDASDVPLILLVRITPGQLSNVFGIGIFTKASQDPGSLLTVISEGAGIKIGN